MSSEYSNILAAFESQGLAGNDLISQEALKQLLTRMVPVPLPRMLESSSTMMCSSSCGMSARTTRGRYTSRISWTLSTGPGTSSPTGWWTAQVHPITLRKTHRAQEPGKSPQESVQAVQRLQLAERVGEGYRGDLRGDQEDPGEHFRLNLRSVNSQQGVLQARHLSAISVCVSRRRGKRLG